MSSSPTSGAEPLPPFQALLDEHGSAVLGFLRATVGPADAEDCFQETFLAALRAYPRLDHGRALRSWLFTIARRKALDHRRAGARRPLPVGEPPATAEQNGSADHAALWALVCDLPEGQAAAVALRFAGGLRYRDVAEALGCSEAAARRRVADALRALRRHGSEIEGLVG